LQAEGLADLRAGLPADDDRFDLGQVAFLVVGEALEQLLAGDQPQDRVAEEFQSFVGGQPRVGAFEGTGPFANLWAKR